MPVSAYLFEEKHEREGVEAVPSRRLRVESAFDSDLEDEIDFAAAAELISSALVTVLQMVVWEPMLGVRSGHRTWSVDAPVPACFGDLDTEWQSPAMCESSGGGYEVKVRY